MSEAKSYRHTSGEWGPHPSYKFELMCHADEHGEVQSFCHHYVSSGQKIIAQVQLGTGNIGYPHVENLIEMKANLALISAGPNFLKACVKLMDEYWNRTADDELPSGAVLDEIKAAILKATTY